MQLLASSLQAGLRYSALTRCDHSAERHVVLQ
jgi:hypothetical protein